MGEARDDETKVGLLRWSRGTVAALCVAFAAVLAAAVVIPRSLDGPGDRSLGTDLEAQRAGLGVSFRTNGFASPIVAEPAAEPGAAEEEEERQVRGDGLGLSDGAGGLVAVGGARRLGSHDGDGRGRVGERRIRGAGPRSARAVRARVREVQGGIQQCYERRMLTSGAVRGLLEVEISVTPAGAIHNVRLRRGSSLDDRVLLACVRSRLSEVQLGRGPAERYVVPIRFVPTEGEEL